MWFLEISENSGPKIQLESYYLKRQNVLRINESYIMSHILWRNIILRNLKMNNSWDMIIVRRVPYRVRYNHCHFCLFFRVGLWYFFYLFLSLFECSLSTFFCNNFFLQLFFSAIFFCFLFFCGICFRRSGSTLDSGPWPRLDLVWTWHLTSSLLTALGVTFRVNSLL